MVKDKIKYKTNLILALMDASISSGGAETFNLQTVYYYQPITIPPTTIVSMYNLKGEWSIGNNIGRTVQHRGKDLRMKENDEREM